MTEFEQLSRQLDEPASTEQSSREALSEEFASDSRNAPIVWQAAVGKNNNTGLPVLELEDSSPGKAEWTIAVDYTADLKMNGTVIGAQQKEEKLRELVETSKGHPEIAIAVQVPDRALTEMPAEGESPPQDVKLERYIIRDGEITNAETVDSIDIDENQTGLLQFATDSAPSEHIGLVIQSHGGGAAGLVGGTGRESLAELSEAIKNGLQGSGHERLDLLDFDSCSMSSPEVFGTISSAADHVVASELRERASKNFGGQNLNAIFTELIENPETSPEDLGKIFIDKANEGSIPEVLKGDPHEHVGADVLSSYDLSAYTEFSNALDEFGASMLDAAQDEQTKKAIENIIDNTTLLPGGKNFPERRDLNDFVSAVKAAAENGELPDEGGAISHAAANVLHAQTNMTEATRKTNGAGYDPLAGMYVSLPVQAVREGSSSGPSKHDRSPEIPQCDRWNEFVDSFGSLL